MEDYDDMLVKRIETLFIHKIIPQNFLALIHNYNVNVLSCYDMERLTTEMKHQPKTDVNIDLLYLMKRYPGWFQCILDVCGDPLLKMAWLKPKFEEIKRQLDGEFLRRQPPRARVSEVAPVGEGGHMAAGQGMETDSGIRVQTRSGQQAESRNCASAKMLPSRGAEPLVMKENMFDDESKRCNICSVTYQTESVKNAHLQSAQHKKNKNTMKESSSQAISPQSVKPKQSPAQPEKTSVIEDHEFFYYDENGSGECMLCNAKYNTREMSKIHFKGKPHKKNLDIRKAKASGLKLGPNGEIFYAFTNGNGKCYVCDVQYPSHDKKKEHINGDKHRRKCVPLMSS